jgi:hypothetical protein
MVPDKRETQPEYYLTGQVVAAYIQVRLTPQNCLPDRQVKGSRAPCIWAFLSSPRKIAFHQTASPLRYSIAAHSRRGEGEDGGAPHPPFFRRSLILKSSTVSMSLKGWRVWTASPSCSRTFKVFSKTLSVLQWIPSKTRGKKVSFLNPIR